MAKGIKIGYIEVTEERSKYQPNYKVFALTKQEIKTTDDFKVDEWDYAGKLENIEIWSIKPTKRLPRSLAALQHICKEMYDKVWNSYEMLLWSKNTRQEIEWDINDWLRLEYGEIKLILEVMKLPKITRKRIPLRLPPGKTFEEWTREITAKAKEVIK